MRQSIKHCFHHGVLLVLLAALPGRAELIEFCTEDISQARGRELAQTASHGTIAGLTKGELRVTAETPSKVVDLSDRGVSDWAHWGRIHGVTILHRKSAVRPLVGDLTKLGTRELHTYENNVTAYSWSDGTPSTRVERTRSGVFTYGQNAGFQIELPADNTPRIAEVYCGVWRGQGRLEATLSDGSAPALTHTQAAQNLEEGDNIVYTIRYRAARAGEHLTVKWTNSSRQGNVTIQAVAIAEGTK
jgi:hypothetical protein